MVTGQAEIETGADFFSFDEHQSEFVLRLPSETRVPKEYLVNRPVLQEVACNGRQTCTHDTGRTLTPRLAHCLSNTCNVDDRAAFETFQVGRLRKQLFRLLISGLQVLGGFDWRRNTLDLRIFLFGAT